jgi:hypothetical protein
MKTFMRKKIGRRKSDRGNSATKNKKSALPVEQHSFSVYDGSVARGFIEQHGPSFTATTLGRKRLGHFPSLKCAMGAFGDAVEAAA